MSKMSDAHIEMQEYFEDYEPDPEEVNAWFQKYAKNHLSNAKKEKPMSDEIILTNQQKNIHDYILNYGNTFTSNKKIENDIVKEGIAKKSSVSSVMTVLRRLGLLECSEATKRNTIKLWKAHPVDNPITPQTGFRSFNTRRKNTGRSAEGPATTSQQANELEPDDFSITEPYTDLFGETFQKVVDNFQESEEDMPEDVPEKGSDEFENKLYELRDLHRAALKKQEERYKQIIDRIVEKAVE